VVLGVISVAKSGVGVRFLAGRDERGIPEVFERGAAGQGLCIRGSICDGNCARHHLAQAGLIVKRSRNRGLLTFAKQVTATP